MREREYLRLKRQIEAEYRQKMEALELVWKMSGKVAGRPERIPRVALQQLVRAFLDEAHEAHDDEFTVDEVFKYVRLQTPGVVLNRASLSGVLQRFVRNGELELVSRGKGSKPSRYRRMGGAAEAA
jgi:hypothetical protein